MRWVSEPPVVRVSVTHSLAEIQVHPDNVSLFGGVAGAVLGVDEFEICDGLVLRKTASFEIGRRAFASCIDKRAIPKPAELQDLWRQRK